MLPKKITPCPIVDALIEIRFKTNLHPSTVFGIIYNEIKQDYPRVENLPILQIPEPIREIDANFKFKPHYKVSNDEFVVQIGPDVISISSSPIYKGWDVFYKNINKCLNQINKLGVINNVLRLGVRYINFFEFDIFDKINLSFVLNEKKMTPELTLFRTELSDGNFFNTLQVSNIASFKNKKGSIIDIDTYTNKDLEKFFSNMGAFIIKGHENEKKLFFSLLKQDFLKTLNPE